MPSSQPYAPYGDSYQPPSPLPAIPGAWPSSIESQSNPPTPIHKRSNTCPALATASSQLHQPVSASSGISPNALYLDHVLQFHQRLSDTFGSRPEDPAGLFSSLPPSASADSAMGPGSSNSDDSDMTRFIRNEHSVSELVDSPTSTTCTSQSSPERLVTAKLPSLPDSDSRYPTRIPRPRRMVDSLMDHGQFSSHARNESQRQSAIAGSPSTPSVKRTRPRIAVPEPSPPPGPSPSRSHYFTSGYESATSPPLSPIMFSSPTSSVFPTSMPAGEARTPVRERSSSYEYASSPSWETSYGSEYNDQHMLRTSSRSVSLSPPSPSPLVVRSGLTRAGSTAPISGRSLSSVDIVDHPSAPMLTTLSLPGSPETSMSLEVSPAISPRLSPVNCEYIPWTLNLSAQPPSPSISESIVPASPSSLSISLSPTSSASRPGLDLEPTITEGHILSFPSPSLLTVSPFASPLPSPLLDGSPELGAVGETSAAAYATALMSSAWDTEELSIPTAIGGNSDIPSSVNLDNGSAQDDEYDPADDTFPDRIEIQYQSVQPRRIPKDGVLAKMRKFGGKVKQRLGFLTGKSKTVSRLPDDIRRVSEAGHISQPEEMSDIIVIENHPTTAQIYDSLLPSGGFDAESIATDGHISLPLPPPPGLATARTRKPRPGLNAQTYVPSHTRSSSTQTISYRRAAPPVIRVCPPSSPGPANVNDRARIDCASNNFSLSPILKAHSRPRTVDEIKSKRRLSLSALTNFAHAFSPSSSSVAPPIITPRVRPRPVSALSFVTARRDSSSLERESDTPHRHPTSTSIRSQHIPVPPTRQNPPESQLPRQNTSRTSMPSPARSRPRTAAPALSSNSPSRSSSIPLLSNVASQAAQTEAQKKKNRRFSLSALSNFAAGHRDEGQWAWNGAVQNSFIN